MQTTNRAIYLGRLMSPQDVKEATLDRTEVPGNVRTSWCLCGDATEEFWCALLDNPDKDKGFRLSAFTTPGDSAYVTFTIQIREMQCRFLLSLSDNKVSKFIGDAQKTGVWLSLGRNDGSQAILQPFLVNPVHLQPISALAKRCKILPPADAFIEFQLAAIEALKPITVPSVLPSFEVSQVSLNIIAPD